MKIQNSYVNYRKNGLVLGGEYVSIDTLIQKTETDFLVVCGTEMYHVCQETKVATKLS